ncbi:type VII secretion-associated serine protease mycosin [Crossiella sp. CA198]|uniref:type VII secretion-associated serine protease mycosin n=1 Tax=Crossiella sp. CA198 TaxID=3455607 RepID=UPI003F8D8623
MGRIRLHATVFLAATLLGLGAGGGLALAAPPPGTCHNPTPARPEIGQLPWAQQVLAPDRAWPFSDGAGVTVAVVDSGVDADHPQLASKVLRGRDFYYLGGLPGNFDCVSHGTAVAGIIAAGEADRIGFRGIAPGARILPVRVSDRDLTDNGGAAAIDPVVLARGIWWAVDQGVKVLNLSVSGPVDNGHIRDAVAYAVSKDVLVVAAAGNQQPDSPFASRPSYPAAYPGVLGVGAIDIDGAKLPASQLGDFVDLVAPGVGVLGPTRAGGHTYFTGTSFAAPFVAGTAALVRARWPELSAAEVTRRLLATATPARGGKGSPGYGAGVVDPYRAVTDGLSAVAPAPVPPLTHPAPDVARLSAEAWWRNAGEQAKAGAAAAVGAALLAVLIAVVLPRGRRRRWAAGTADPLPATPVREELPEQVFLLPPPPVER